MTITQEDISFVLSGGSSNVDPDDSLGGDPSSQPVSPSSFWSDISNTQAEAGYTDYRCIYVANDSSTDTLFDAKFYVAEEVSGGADVAIGMLFRTDVQEITIAGISSLSSGHFTLLYDGESVTVNYNSSPTTWGFNLQTALRTLDYLEDVTVSTSTSGDSIIFQVSFSGSADHRYHPLLVESGNSLSPVGSTISIAKISNGSPMNAVVDDIDAATTPPTGVTFSTPDVNAPIEVGDLRPLDTCGVWMRRSVAAGTEAVESDGFQLRLAGSPLSSE